MITRALPICLAISLLVGCTAPRAPRVLDDPDPTGRIPAMHLAANSRNQSSLPQLVANLSDDDPAVRFYAISALDRITGQRLGYDYYADEAARQKAVQRWQLWLQSHESTTRPSAP